MSRRTQMLNCTLATFLLCVYITASATPTTTTTQLASSDEAKLSTNSSTNNSSNYNCPEDCQCTINEHKSLLHAKCNSTKGLKSELAVHTTLPIHSIDLSYLSLSRLSHSLDKLRDLTSIDLSHNELHEIGHLGRRIKKLNLRHNRITSIKLTKLPQHVQVLNLQHNDITYLPLELTKLTHLQTLELAHNQINCSCETLEVRNWLQERHVFMGHPVKCSFPVEVSGKSWLQVKQSDICDKEKEGWSANLVADNDDDELMMGDQPIEGSADNDEEEELGKAFLPIDHKSTTSQKSNEINSNDVEGSGDLSEMNMPVKLAPVTRSTEPLSDEPAKTEPTDTDDDEGSGSGGGLLFIPHLIQDPREPDDFETPDDDDDDADNKPLAQPTPEATPSPDVFGAGMGIFGGIDNDGISTGAPANEELIVPVVHHVLDADSVPDDEVTTDGPVDGDAAEAIRASVGQSDDSNATYFLLGVIVLIVLGLILYVGIKRCKYNRNRAHDAENPRQTELLDMDKKHPGKPKQQNGTENAPLIGEKSKSDLAKPINGANKKAYEAGDIKDGPAKEQLLHKDDANGLSNGSAPAETGAPQQASPNELSPHEYYPITPRYPTPKSPRASKYSQQPNGTEQNNNNNEDDAYRAASPKTGRYSPVYSPETGRVKIKLTETPKPKTPMLVTRSKSNAGDIITTPVHLGTLETPAVYVTPVGGANGYVDGH